MRATSSTSSLRRGKQRLLGSCALAAGLMALALGGPALAQGVNGTGASGGLGSAAITSPNPGTTHVEASTAQTIINWTPTDSATTGAPIDFLPAGNNLEFYGSGDYTVLNRFVGRDALGNPIPISRQVGLNGTVNSFIGTPFATSGNVQGGNIWFYNAGGILIGGTAVINVGSLLLTANDIDTTGGLFSPSNQIRFRGVSGSVSPVTISSGASINASKANPGSSYVALVAPRIVQAGTINTDGSTALVAAEQADIRINNGLFDINVLVGAEGGNVITHTGVTSGPAHQQNDINDNRVYMVAIPKNDAVTMLVAGQVGYRDALVAQTDPDGAVVLSAGYNISSGQTDFTPANGTAANITIADTLFLSDTSARASGALVAAPLSTVPAPGGTFLPPPQLGRIVVQGDGSFVGDASASLTVGTGHIVGATGDLTVSAGGTSSAPGTATVTTTGGQLLVLGDLTVAASGPIAADGSSNAGTASLDVTGGTVDATNVNVTASTTGGIGGSGVGGNAIGGNASITVSGAGALTADMITARANAAGGGLFLGQSFETLAVDIGGNATGGTATISVVNGGTITANDVVAAEANGQGQTGNLQSGDGMGGTARIEVSGSGASINTPVTQVTAVGMGGANFPRLFIGPIPTLVGGDGTGGSATLALDGDDSNNFNFGQITISTEGYGGSSTGSGGLGGTGRGGISTISATGNLLANPDSVDVLADGAGGGGTSSDNTHRTGDAFGGTVNIDVNSNASFSSDSYVQLSANGLSAFGENRGDSTGGEIVVQVTSGGAFSALNAFGAEATAGRLGFSETGIAGNSTGGNISLIADGGTISGASLFAYATAERDNAFVTGGTAQGGTITLSATNNGAITAVDSVGQSEFYADAITGVSPGGSNATGGSIQLIADGGLISLDGDTSITAGGTTGGDVDSGSVPSLGLGGSILIQVLDNSSTPSAITITSLRASADGRSDVLDEGSAFFGGGGSSDGTGGTVTVDVQGGTFTASNAVFSADGFGGNIGGGGTTGGTGQGGSATFTQTGGAANIGTLTISAAGEGGIAFIDAPGGTGIGGTATLNLFGGTLDAQNIFVVADGIGGFGIEGDDSMFSPTPAGDGGEAIGGLATINLIGDAVVTAQSIMASSTASGGSGGGFFAFNGGAGDTGNGGNATGGTADINIVSGTLNTGDLIADASGIGGDVREFFDASSSGSPTGVGVGGTGGAGQGGTATINLLMPVNSGGTVSSVSRGVGGAGGNNGIGGNGNDGFGGTAQVIIDDFDAGALAVTLDSSATGGNGGVGQNGAGGHGGSATGGTSRVQANGPNSSVIVTDANFTTGGLGGNGGASFLTFGNFPTTGPDGGNGGNGTGGTLEIVSNEGSVTLGIGRTGITSLSSAGTGGDGGAGADNNNINGLRGGNGGNGGNGIGGDVNLLAIGGSISSGGESVIIASGGSSGNGAMPGSGISVTNMGVTTGGPGSFGFSGLTQGGRVTISSEDSSSATGQIDLGDTAIDASGDFAGYINIMNTSVGTGISFGSLDATVFGAPLVSVPPSPFDSGIRFASTDGQILVNGDASLISDGQIRFDMDGDGHLLVNGSINAFSSSLITATHINQINFNPGVSADGDMIFDSSGDITSDQDSQFNAGGDIDFNAGQSIDIASASAGNNTSLVSSGSTNAIAASAGGDVYVEGGSVGVGFASSGSNTTFFATGSDAFFGTIDSGSSTMIDAFGGVFGSDINAGSDVTITAGGGGQIDSIFAGDDIRVNFSGDLNVGTMGADGFGFDDEGDGANIEIFAGATQIDHAEAGNDFIADVGSIQTGLESIITGGNIDITAVGAADLGNSTAGGFVSVNAESIAFNDVDAGSFVNLNASGDMPGAEGITGASIVAGNFVSLTGNSISIGAVTTDSLLSATATGGSLNIDAALAADTINAMAADEVTGGYEAQGDIVLRAGSNVFATADATGFQSSSSGPPIAANVSVFADGDVEIGSGGATGMFGVSSGGSATVSNLTVGEDLLVHAGTSASLTDVTAGDDIEINADGPVTALRVTATGAGPDNRELLFSIGSATGAVPMFQTNGVFPDGANIFMASNSDTIDADTVNAAGNITLIAQSTVNTVGTIQSGLATSITGTDLNLENVTAGTDISLTSTVGGITAIGALAAGHDLTIDAAGDVDLSEADAGDDIRIDASGALAIANAFTFGTGSDDESDGSSIVISAGATTIGHAESADNFTANVGSLLTGSETIITGGNIMVFAAGNIDGTFVAGGDILLNSDGNVTASATANGGYQDQNDDEFEGNVFVDAVGNVVMTDSLAAQMFGVNAGGSVSLTNVDAGEDLSFIAGTTAMLTNVSAGDDIEGFANGLITASGVFATGEGDDFRTLLYDIDPTGFLIDAGEGNSTTNGADLTLVSLNGALNLTDLEAGDDIDLGARTSLTVNGARTQGLGVTGGDSSIFTSSGGNTTIADIDAFDDLYVDSGGNVDVTGAAVAGRDIFIEGDTIAIASLFTPGNSPIDALDAGRDLSVLANGNIMGGRSIAGRDLSMTGASIFIDRATSGGDLSLTGNNGVTAADVDSGGQTTLLADQGDIMINSLTSQDMVSAIGDSVVISGNNNLTFSTLETDVGDALVSTSGNLTVTDGMVAGGAMLQTGGGDINITQLTANEVDLESGRDITLGTVTATNDLFAEADRTLFINNGVTARNISVGSSDIVFGANGRLGTAGSTEIVDVRNTNPDNQTFVGGTGTRNGYHIDATELVRLFGDDITIFAPRVTNSSNASVGSAAPPDVIIDDFTLTAGSSTANLGATGSLTITTPGKARVIGDAALTGMSDANAFNIFASDALEVILGLGTIRLTGTGNAPGGMLNLQSEDVIVATTEAISDVGAATTTDAIDARLAMNDGVTIDEGALFANGINVSVVGGFYVQNSGTGTDFDQRRGLTFGALGLNVDTEDPSTRIVINGVQLGPNGQITGLDTIPLLSIGGSGSGTGSTSGPFDQLSTFNGCLIANPASCVVIFTPEIESSFPVQDIIEQDNDGEGEEADGFGLPIPLITIRDIDPLTGEPLLDDPVTGAGNDDLWTPPAE